MTIKKPRVSDVPHLKRLWKEAFGDTDEFIDGFFSLGFSPDRSLALYCEDEIASVIYWFDCEFKNNKVAYIYGVATRKRERGKGYSTLLMKRAHELLLNSGYSGAILVPAGEDLFSFYKRLGYCECCFIDEEEYPASNVELIPERISPEEYVKLRKAFLSSESVIFDNSCLHFLAYMSDFYKGENFLFAKSNDIEKLRFLEFFGNKNCISDIVHSLKYESATVRVLGKARPFAAFISFNGDFVEKPDYLGFAFD